jgi:hypothetical protein
MAQPRAVQPALLVVAAFSRYPEALAWARQCLEQENGPTCRASDAFAFHQTAYYAPTMGEGLRKQFLVFRDLVMPDRLTAIKLRTNALETELAASGAYAEVRPLNLDPGLMTLGKFMLATTKDQAHRIYLGEGIYAEVTLHYRGGAWAAWPWTYADYREPEVLAFLGEAREDLRRLLKGRNR